MRKDFRETLRERVLIFDGAMGTSIQDRGLSLDDFEGQEGCNEILVLSRPQVIREIHARFLEVGCDAIETNTFGASRLVLGEYGLAEKAYEINRAAARLACEVAAELFLAGAAPLRGRGDGAGYTPPVARADRLRRNGRHVPGAGARPD